MDYGLKLMRMMMMMVMMVMIVRGSSAEKKRVYSKEGSWTGLDFKSGVKCK